MNDFYTPEKKKHRYFVQMEVSVEVELDGDVDADAAADYAQSLVVDNGFIVDDVWQPMVMTDDGWKEVEDK